jgi:hypothetical protein
MPPFLNLSGIISLREWVYLNWYRAHAVEADGTPMDFVLPGIINPLPSFLYPADAKH